MIIFQMHFFHNHILLYGTIFQYIYVQYHVIRLIVGFPTRINEWLIGAEYLKKIQKYINSLKLAIPSIIIDDDNSNDDDNLSQINEQTLSALVLRWWESCYSVDLFLLI